MKRLATVQDLSCLGKCSLTVALPVISAMGIECAVLPTAVLSTHTGFPGNTCLDLSGELLPMARHWHSLGVHLDGISTGYLANAAQCDQVAELLSLFPGVPLFVDPVMGDNGKLYRGMAPEFPRAMGALCARAAVIVPNLTEACLLTGRAYNPRPTRGECQSLLSALLDLGCGSVVLTGIPGDGKIGVAVQTRGEGPIFRFAPKIPWSFHGTGDIFSAVTVGSLLQGLPLEEAAIRAAQFVAACLTAADPAKEPFGVPFETCLSLLIPQSPDVSGGE